MTKLKDFQKKSIDKNVWNAIAEELRVEDGAEVEKEFIKLRGKYSRYERN